MSIIIIVKTITNCTTKSKRLLSLPKKKLQVKKEKHHCYLLSSVTKFSRNSKFDIHTIACMTTQQREEKKNSKLRNKKVGAKKSTNHSNPINSRDRIVWRDQDRDTGKRQMDKRWLKLRTE